MQPPVTDTPAPKQMTYDDYLAKYMAQMGVGPTATPTATPKANYGAAPSAPSGGVGGIAPLAGVALGAKLGTSMFGGAPVGVTMSPGTIPAVLGGTPALELGGLTPMLPGGGAATAAPVAASTAGTAAAGTAASTAASGAVPTGLLTGANPALYFGAPLAGMAAFSALAPKVAPKIGDAVSDLMGWGRPDRTYIQKEVVDSNLLNNQLPGWSKLSAEQRGKIADAINAAGLLSLPGGQGRYTAGPLQWDPNLRIRGIIPGQYHEFLEGKFGKAFERNTPLETLLAAIPSTAVKRMDQEKLGLLRGAIETAKAQSALPALPADPALASKITDWLKGPASVVPTQKPVVVLPARSKTLSPGISKDGKRITY